MPLHLANLVLTVTYDVAALPRDGVFRFNNASADYSEASKEHMKAYIYGELRKMHTGFHAIHRPTARKLFSQQQMVQIDYHSPILVPASTSDAAWSVQCIAFVRNAIV
eukprot:6182154-Pleurochrysis_carterae.AAC.4